jgi:hypothetical protein
MSWLFSQALVEEYLGDTCLDGEPSVQLNGKPTQQAYCAPDKMTDFSRLSPFGMTFKPLTENRGEELLTLFLEDFRAKTFPQRGGGLASKEKEAECGEKWHGLLARFDLDSHLWRTVQCSLLEDLNESLQTLPQWGMTVGGELYLRPMLERHTKETVFGFSVPTPVASDATSGAVIGKNDTFYTTSTGMPRKVNQKGTDGSVGLERLVKMWPTPQASDNRDRGNMSNPSVQRRVAIGKQISLSQSVHPTSGQLNPTWVEWLMGWPLGWTDLKPLVTDKFPCVQQQHGES